MTDRTKAGRLRRSARLDARRCSAAGELHEIDAEVDWNIELGTITAAGAGAGHRAGAPVQQHQGLQQAGQPLPPRLRRRARAAIAASP